MKKIVRVKSTEPRCSFWGLPGLDTFLGGPTTRQPVLQLVAQPAHVIPAELKLVVMAAVVVVESDIGVLGLKL